MPKHVLVSDYEIITDGGRRRRRGKPHIENQKNLFWPWESPTGPRVQERKRGSRSLGAEGSKERWAHQVFDPVRHSRKLLQELRVGGDGMELEDEEVAALARATVNLFRAWDLTDAEARTLLGDMPQREWAQWQAGDIGRIDRDLRSRMSILMGIHKALRYLFTNPARGYAWIRKSNATLEGKSALDVMIQGDIEDLIDVRSNLDAELAV